MTIEEIINKYESKLESIEVTKHYGKIWYKVMINTKRYKIKTHPTFGIEYCQSIEEIIELLVNYTILKSKLF